MTSNQNTKAEPPPKPGTSHPPIKPNKSTPQVLSFDSAGPSSKVPEVKIAAGSDHGKSDQDNKKIGTVVGSKENQQQLKPPTLAVITASDILREFYLPEKEILRIQRSRVTSIGSSSVVSNYVADRLLEFENIPFESTEEGSNNRPELYDEGISESFQKDTNKKTCSLWFRTRGIILAIFSSFQVATSGYLAFYLGRTRNYTVSVLLITRFVSLFICSLVLIPFLTHRNVQVISAVWPLSIRKKRWVLLRIFLRSLCGVMAGICHYTSLQYISPADSATVLYVNPVFVSFGARIFLKERISVCQTITAVFAIMGVVLIARPPFLTGEKLQDEHLYGILFALAAMLGLTGAILFLRSLRETNFTLLTLCFGVSGIITGLVMGLVTESLVRNEEITQLDLLMLFALGFLSFGGIVALTFALHFEQAGPIATARSTEIMFSFVLQTFSGIYPDVISGLGAAVVLLCIFLTGFYKYVGGLEPTNNLRKKLGFVLK